MRRLVLLAWGASQSSGPLAAALAAAGCEIDYVSDADAAVAALARRAYEAVVVGGGLSGSAPALAGRSRAAEGRPGVLVVGEPDGPEVVVAALQAGVADWVMRPASDEAVARAALRISEERQRRTASERAERSVARLAEHLVHVIEASSDAMLTVAADGTILRWNRAAEDIYGYGAAAVLGQPLRMLEVDAGAEERRRLRVLGGQRIVNEEVERVRADGRRFVALLSLARVAAHDPKSRALLETSRDVSAQKELARELQVHDRLTTLASLTAGLAHEINNPLAVVQANLELIQEGTEKGPLPTADLQELIGEALDGAIRIGHVVQHLRSFARPVAEQPAEVSLCDVVAGAIGIARIHARGHANPVEVDVGPTQPVPCLPNRLSQAVLNLILNALDASGPAGRVRVRSRQNGDVVVLEVHDDGPGVPPDLRERIFEPFFTTKGQSGTGLGLAIARQIAAEHGGRLELMPSAEGGGTCFSLLLPVFDPSRYTILLVDDEPQVLRSLARSLQHAGYRTAEASSIAEGRRLMEQARHHAVITDLHLAGESGVDFLTELRAKDPAVRRIAITGNVAVLDSPTFWAPAEPWAVLAKPWQDRILRDTVRRALLLTPV